MTTKSNQEYWERRHLQTKAKQIKSTEAYEKALQPELNGLYRDLHGEMEQWYTKYANTNGIDKEEAKKALNSVNTKHWQLTLKQFEAKAKSGGYKDELDSEYYRSRVARLQDLEAQLQHHTQSFTSHRTDVMRNGLAKQYDDTYMRTNFNIQASKGTITSNFARFNEAQLKMAVSSPWGKDGKDFSKRIWKNYQKELPSYLMDAVLRGTVLGWSPAKVSQMFHARFQDIKQVNIHNLVVSEMGHVAEEATAKGYEENDIEQYEYMATLESHTCDTCGRLDGQIFRLDKRIVGINYPLIHARCRCTTVPYIEDLPEVTERWTRDPDTGKGKMVKDVKFNEWKKSLGDRPSKHNVPLLPGIDPMNAKFWPRGLKVTGLPDGDMVTLDSERGQRLGTEWLNKLIRYEDDEDLSGLLPRGMSEEQADSVKEWVKQVKLRNDAVETSKAKKLNALMTDDEITELYVKTFTKAHKPTEAEISRVGKSIYERGIGDDFSIRLKAIKDETQEMSEQVRKTREKANVAYNKYMEGGPQAQEFGQKSISLYRKADKINKEIEKIRPKYESQQADKIAEVISKYREIGRNGVKMKFRQGSEAKIEHMLDDVYDYYPADWFSLSNSMDNLQMRVFETERGYYRPGYENDAELALSSLDEADGGMRVAFHELGHRQETLNPEITKLEHDFYARRTAGDKLEKLSKITGNEAYSSYEKARKDNFLSAYMGKDYGNTESSAYELLSMGLESVYRMSYDITKDKDYAQFILGLLAIM